MEENAFQPLSRPVLLQPPIVSQRDDHDSTKVPVLPVHATVLNFFRRQGYYHHLKNTLMKSKPNAEILFKRIVKLVSYMIETTPKEIRDTYLLSYCFDPPGRAPIDEDTNRKSTGKTQGEALDDDRKQKKPRHVVGGHELDEKEKNDDCGKEKGYDEEIVEEEGDDCNYEFEENDDAHDDEEDNSADDDEEDNSGDDDDDDKSEKADDDEDKFPEDALPRYEEVVKWPDLELEYPVERAKQAEEEDSDGRLIRFITYCFTDDKQRIPLLTNQLRSLGFMLDTIRSYINGIRVCYKWLPLRGVKVRDSRQLLDIISEINKALRKEAEKQRSYCREERTSQKQVTLVDVWKKFEPVFECGRRKVEDAIRMDCVNKQHITTYIKLIICNMWLQTFNARPQAVQQLTLEQYHQLKDKGHVLSTNFKSQYAYKFQAIFASPTAICMMETYEKYLRDECVRARIELLGTETSDPQTFPFFISPYGGTLKRIPSILKKFTGKGTRDIRSMVATEAEDAVTNGIISAGDLKAIQLANGHSATTSTSIYNRPSWELRGKTVKTAFEAMKRFHCTDEDTPASIQETTSTQVSSGAKSSMNINALSSNDQTAWSSSSSAEDSVRIGPTSSGIQETASTQVSSGADSSSMTINVQSLYSQTVSSSSLTARETPAVVSTSDFIASPQLSAYAGFASIGPANVIENIRPYTTGPPEIGNDPTRPFGHDDWGADRWLTINDRGSRRPAWTDQEKEWVRNWCQRRCNRTGVFIEKKDMKYCLYAIARSEAARRIFHPHHVAKLDRIQHVFETLQDEALHRHQ